MTRPHGFGSMLTVMGVVFIGMTGFGIFFPIFPFLAMHVGATPTETTLAMGAYSLGQLISGPIWGRISDRHGRKFVLVIGVAGAATSYLLLANADTIETMASVRLFSGLMAGNLGAAFAAAADLADERTRARNMGLLGAAVGLGFIAGPALGAFIVGNGDPDMGDFQRVCYAAAAMAGFGGLFALTFFRETLPKEMRRDASLPRPPQFRLLVRRPELARFILVMLLMIGAQALMESVFALWADAALEWGPREVGFTMAGIGLVAAILQGGGAGRVSRLFGDHKVLLTGVLIFAFGFAILGFAENASVAIAGIIGLTVGGALATPALQSLVAMQANHEERGAVIGLSQSAAALGRVIGPASSGAIFDQLGHGAPFFVGAVVLIGAFFVTLGAKPAPHIAQDAEPVPAPLRSEE
jgi:DHA1 family tetracycline resistance protein-like MFS transporter